ncbi:MAG: DUF5777 family beta-barrel protein [Bacteroidota bacterium]
MKNIKSIIKTSFLALMICFTSTLFAQANDAPASSPATPVKKTFGSSMQIDNQTVMVPVKGTLEADIQHRFGLMNNKNQGDLWGVYAPANIRLGISYVPVKNLMVGYGITKDKMLMDFSAKYAVLQQAKGGMPVSVTLFGNVAIDTRDAKDNNVRYEQDRYSYFSSLMIARKVTEDFSLQVSGNISWMNNVEGAYDASNKVVANMENMHISTTVLGRYKISQKSAIIAGYDQPLTAHKFNNPCPNVCFGFETTTSAHAFQIFATTYKGIVPQYNNFYNQNDFSRAYFLLGFNITRLWNL